MISAQPRNLFGTLKSNALRKNALIPATIYSKSGTVVHIAISEKEFTKLIQDYKFLNTKLEIALDDKVFIALPRTIDFHPITERILHIEFKEVPAEGVIEVVVPVDVINRAKSVGIKGGGKLNIAAHNILVQCESSAIPEKVTIDIEKFGIGRTIFTTSLPANPAYSFPKKTFILSILGRGRKDKGEVVEEQK